MTICFYSIIVRNFRVELTLFRRRNGMIDIIAFVFDRCVYVCGGVRKTSRNGGLLSCCHVEIRFF